MAETILVLLLVLYIKKINIKPVLKHWSAYPFLLGNLIWIYLTYMIFSGDYSLIYLTNIKIGNSHYNVIKTVYLATLLPLVFKYDLYLSLFKSIKRHTASIADMVKNLFTSPVMASNILLILGGKLNDIAISSNDGKMPVFFTVSKITGYYKSGIFEKMESQGDYHVLAGPATNFFWLTDILDTGYSCLSMGDVLIRAAVFVLLYYSVKSASNTT